MTVSPRDCLALWLFSWLMSLAIGVSIGHYATKQEAAKIAETFICHQEAATGRHDDELGCEKTQIARAIARRLRGK